MIIIPSHVRRTASNTYAVLQRESIKNPKSKKIEADCEKVGHIIDCLNQREVEIISKGDCYVIMLNAMNDILKIVQSLPLEDRQRILLETDVDDELIDALNYAEIKYPQMKMDLEKIAQLLIKPNESIEKVDAYCDCRNFKLVESEERWHEIVDEKGYDLTKDAFGKPYFKEIKVYFLIEYTGYNQVAGAAARAKKHLISVLGEKEVESKKRAFEKLFKLGVIGTYYIYIPL